MTDSTEERASTVLTLSGVGVPPYSARGLRQQLSPIDASAQVRRSINGSLVDISGAQFRKYQSSINGDDQQPPAVDLVWPGRLLNVGCIVELSQLGEVETETGTTDPVLGRPAVPGSIRTESGFTFYRPILAMRVLDFSVVRDEWGDTVGWTLDLEEV